MPQQEVNPCIGVIDLAIYQAKAEECFEATSALTATQERLTAAHAASAALAATLQHREAELTIIKEQLTGALEAADHAEAVVSEDNAVISAQRDHIQQLEQLVEILQLKSMYLEQQQGSVSPGQGIQQSDASYCRRESDPGQCSDFRSKQLKFEQLGHLHTMQKLADAEYQLAAAQRSRGQLERRVTEIEQQLEQSAEAATAGSRSADAAALQQQLQAAVEAVEAKDAQLATLSAELRACPFQLARYQAIINHQERKVAFLQQQLGAAQCQAQQLVRQQQQLPRQPVQQHPPTAAEAATAATGEDHNWCLLEAAAAWLEAHRLKKKLATARDQLASVQEQLLGWQCADIIEQLSAALCMPPACAADEAYDDDDQPGEDCNTAQCPSIPNSSKAEGPNSSSHAAGQAATGTECQVVPSMSTYDSSSSLLQTRGSDSPRGGGMHPSQHLGPMASKSSNNCSVIANYQPHTIREFAANLNSFSVTTVVSTLCQSVLSLVSLFNRSRGGLQQSAAAHIVMKSSSRSRTSSRAGGLPHKQHKWASHIGADVTVSLKSK